MDSKEEAQQAANELLNQMQGGSWTTRVWENLGWHYQVSSGNLFVWPAHNGLYMAGLSDDPELLAWHVKSKTRAPGGTPAFWSVSKSFKDPNEAVKAQVKRAREFVNARTLIVLDAEATIGAQ